MTYEQKLNRVLDKISNGWTYVNYAQEKARAVEILESIGVTPETPDGPDERPKETFLGTLDDMNNKGFSWP